MDAKGLLGEGLTGNQVPKDNWELGWGFGTWTHIFSYKFFPTLLGHWFQRTFCKRIKQKKY
jgi:hypothetical protein